MAFAWQPPKPAKPASGFGTPPAWGSGGGFQAPQSSQATFGTPAPAPAPRPATAEDAYAQAAKNSADYYTANPSASRGTVQGPGQTAADYEANGRAPIQMTGIPEPLPAPGTGGLTPDQAILNQQANRPTQMGDFYDTLAGHGAPTYQSDYYDYAKGQAGKSTNTETLYDERKGGYDPAAQYQDDRAVRSINDQLAARGGYNSGAGVRQIGDYYANANAQRSRDLAALAGSADAGRLGRDAAYGSAASGAGGAESDYYNLLGHAAGGASGEQSDYYSGLTREATDIASGKAGVSQAATAQAGKVFSDAEFEKIQAELKKAGVDVEQIKNDKESLQTLVSLYAGGAGGAAGKAGGAAGKAGGGAGGGAGAGDTSKSWYV